MRSLRRSPSHLSFNNTPMNRITDVSGCCKKIRICPSKIDFSLLALSLGHRGYPFTSYQRVFSMYSFKSYVGIRRIYLQKKSPESDTGSIIMQSSIIRAGTYLKVAQSINLIFCSSNHDSSLSTTGIIIIQK